MAQILRQRDLDETEPSLVFIGRAVDYGLMGGLLLITISFILIG